jgi:hypothetical protein
MTRERHSAVATSPKAVRRSRDRGSRGHRILRRVPPDGRHPGSSRSVDGHTRRRRWPWRLVHSRPARHSAMRAHGQTEAKASGAESKNERRQGCQRLVASCTVGRKRPRSRTKAVRRRSQGSCSLPPAEAVSDGVKRPVPQSRFAEPRLRGTTKRRKPWKVLGTREVRVHASSYEWQTSVGRIMRLPRREVARPRGTRGR